MTDPRIEDAELREIFRVESAEHLQQVEAGLLALERDPHDAALLQEVFREAHSLKGAARMLGLRSIQTLAHEIENLLGEAREGRARLDGVTVPPQLERLDRIRALVAQAVAEPPAGDAGPPDAGSPARVTAAPTPPEPPAAPPPPAADWHLDTLRVDASRLDALLRLSGELVVARGRIARWPGLAGSGGLSGAAELAGWHTRMVADVARLDAVIDEIGRGIHGLRLLPVSTLLDLFPRMVHDLARDLGKRVAYRVEGGSVVADKRVIEELRAPLTHLLRNALDHGIEPPAERRAAGKPEEGSVRVRVLALPDAVTVQVIDDGRGLDGARIGQRALALGLVGADALARMSPAQVQSLILRAGFSMAGQVSELSGRGVGLDVVRAAVERLHGSLDIASVPGQGLTVSLRLPVSLTVTRAMLLRDGDRIWAIPFDDIVQMRRLKPDEVTLVEGRPSLRVQDGMHDRVHDRVAALVRLDALLDDRAVARPLRAGDHVVVVRAGRELLAIVVDAVLDAADLVIKPVPPALAPAPHVGGLALRDDGEVCALLQPHSLLARLSDGAALPAEPARTPPALEVAAHD